MTLLSNLGCIVVWKKGLEADDLICQLVNVYTQEDIVIVSMDKDFYQLINDRVSLWSPTKDILYTPKNLKNRLGFTPKQSIDYLILTGDSSDNIPGYRGIGEKRGLDFLQRYSSISKFLHSSALHNLIDKTKLAQLRIINRKLINLQYYYKRFRRNKPIPYFTDDSPFFNKGLVNSLARKFEITTFVKPEFIDAFKKLT